VVLALCSESNLVLFADENARHAERSNRARRVSWRRRIAAAAATSLHIAQAHRAGLVPDL